MAKVNLDGFSGDPLMLDYTPGADVAVEDIVVVGDTVMICHRPIAAGKLGALAAGGGVYKFPKATGGGTAIAARKRVWYHAGTGVVNETATDGVFAGVTTTIGAGDNDAYVEVEHQSLGATDPVTS